MTFTPLAKLVIHYVNTTNRTLFLTGKAGTGKTTLLRYLIKHTHKRTAVAAPTGIAAINAGGVTLHSLLQLPFGTFVPEERSDFGAIAGMRLNTPRSVLSELKIRGEKRQLLRDLELLIIDEVSMLRADLLDCIDLILKNIRRRHGQPFGGVQVLFIGDLNQLPPVVKQEEWKVLSKYYRTVFFFGSRVLQASPPLYIELDKIYRQSDPTFIDLLNRLRDNRMDELDIETLNNYYREDHEKKVDEGYIHITTHNRKADAMNESRLEALPGKTYTFTANVMGKFPENMYPLPEKMPLKEGAQVMFIKNDPSGRQRFFNGKLGEVVSLSETKIKVRCQGDAEAITVERYIWENKRYRLEKGAGEVEEEVIGTFSHFPLRLAWAITVHKSQGLTFDRAVLDLSGSFAPGQMYVALSRLTGLDGLVLASPIPYKNLSPEAALLEFSRQKQEKDVLEKELETERKAFLLQSLQKTFQFGHLTTRLQKHLMNFNKDAKRSARQQYKSWTQERLDETEMLKEVADKFLRQINRIAREQPADLFERLTERTQKAEGYFTPRLQAIQDEFKAHKKDVSTQKQVKGYLREVTELELMFIEQERTILKTKLLLESMQENKALSKEDLSTDEQYKKLNERGEQAQQKVAKPKTKDITYDFFRKGLSPEEIADARELTVGTIFGHLTTLLQEGKVTAEEVLGRERIEELSPYLKGAATSLNELMEEIPFPCTYHELRLVLAHQGQNKA